MLAFVLALPALGAQEEKKPQKPGEQFQSLVKDFNDQRQQAIQDYQKTKGEEQKKHLDRYFSLGKDYAEKFFKLADDNPKDPAAADALAWVVMNGTGTPFHEKATDRILKDYSDHTSIRTVAQSMLRAPGGEDRLKKLLEADGSRPRVKAAAALALGESLASRLDRLGDKPEAEKVAADADKLLAQALDLAKGSADLTADAERGLRILRQLRVGKEAPDIKGKDLDGKEFKLSDYRGKVVLLDFWGDW